MRRQYITTAIDYPNAAPHMGHVLEKILADVIARWFRLRGDEVRFQIGTDEHGTKIQRTAEAEGIPPKELVDRNVPLFQDLYRRLRISDDHFIRTTDREEHWPTVSELWKRLHKAGALEKRSYTGLYCSGCERFMATRDLIRGKCPHHNAEPEEVTEENWFFLLSREGAWLKELLTKRDGGYAIVPGFRSRETLSLIERGLEDVSFSRPRASLSWGIPVPGDGEQTMYVWCDALTNYISSLDYFNLACNERSGDVSRPGVEWWDDAIVTHVIGKDIARFHALYWPSMLKHAGVRTPDRLLIHGFLTSEGEKMSKTTGNVVVPDEVIGAFGVDPLRFTLSHEVPVGRDGDFSWKRMREIYDAKLRDDIGNLLNRVLVLLMKDNGTVSGSTGDEKLLGDSWERYEEHMNAFEISEALQVATGLAARCNRFIDGEKPWELKDDGKRRVLTRLAEALRHLSLLLLPFVPDTAQRIATQLNVPYAESMADKGFVIGNKKEWGAQKDWRRVGKPEILFKPLE